MFTLFSGLSIGLGIFFIVLFFFLIIFLLQAVYLVRQAEAIIIERLGRYDRTGFTSG